MGNRLLLVVLLSAQLHLAESAEHNPSEVSATLEKVRSGEMYLPTPPTSGERWIPGLHYNLLHASPYKGSMPRTVEIIELSMYTTWVAPKEFKEELHRWIKSNKERMTLVRLPAIAFGMPHARVQARIFFTIEALGRSDLHEQLDIWAQDSSRNPVYHNIWHPDEKRILDLTIHFTKNKGVSEQDFVRLYHSEQVENDVRDAEIRTGAFNVNGTPTYVVNRRFSTSAQRLAHPRPVRKEDFDRLFDLIVYLANSEASIVREN